MSEHYFEYDLFIAYHGSDSHTGSKDKAARIYDYLIQRDPRLKCYFFKQAESSKFSETPDIVSKSKKFLLVCNPSLDVDRERGGVVNREHSNGVYKEIVAFNDLIYGNIVADDDIKAYVYNGATPKFASDLHSCLNHIVHFDESTQSEADCMEDVYRWVTRKGYSPMPHSSSNHGSYSHIEPPSYFSSHAEQTAPDAPERLHNTYFTVADKKETQRLKIQRDLLKDFDGDVYERALEGKESAVVLDVASNFGDMIMDRIGHMENVSKIICIDCDADAVEIGRQKYGSDRVKFYQSDVEDDDFGDMLFDICEENGIEKFDLINMSMILLHLEKPHKVLKKLNKFLDIDGTVVIRDIDDGFNVAYPDEGRVFAKAMEICLFNKISGYRRNGRCIYGNLTRAGFKTVSLEKIGLSTVSMTTPEQRDALFDTYFSFIMYDAELLYKQHPDEKKYIDNYKFMKKNYDDMAEKFQSKEFFFNLGFVLFTASKKDRQ